MIQGRTGRAFILYVLATLAGMLIVFFYAQNVFSTNESYELESAHSSDEYSVGKIQLDVPTKGIREFSSIDELQNWLKNDDLDSYSYKDYDFDCDDFAYELVRRAWTDGFYMETEVMKQESGENHITNKTKIGNMLYKVNPETDKISVLCPLD